MMNHLASEDFSEIISSDQYPENTNLCSVSQWKQNWKCLILTFLTFSCLLTIFLCHHQQISNYTNINLPHDSFSSNKNICWMLIFCAIILYSLYLMECSYATEKIQLCNCNTEKIEDVKEKIQQMKNAEPIVWWKATCYHYARRKRRTTRFRRGTYFISTKVFQERVNSFASSASFNFSNCGVRDISNNLILDESSGPVVKFIFSKGFAFSNMASAIEFEEQRSIFFRQLRRYDDYMDIQEGLDLTDCGIFQEEILALNTPGKKPWFTNPFYYWLYSCCLLSWPFRLILSNNTIYIPYKITKLFGTNYSNISDSSHELALLHLYDTRRLSLNENEGTPVWSDIAMMNESTGNIHQIDSELAPSYSEAMLLLDDQQIVTEIQDENINKTEENYIRNRNERIYRVYDTITGLVPSSFLVNENSSSNERLSSYENLTEDNPPVYEEALMFPIVECDQLPTSERNFHCNVSIDQLQTYAQSEMRLPSSRTFLSIETSL